MNPYWLEGLGAQTPALSGEHGADVVVIGAGLCGASAALALAEAGLNPLWLERGFVSVGASGRNAGFVLQGTAERYSRAIGVMGRERARRVHGWSRDNHLAMAETVKRFGIDCGYQRRGSLQLACAPEEEAELLESAARLAEDGFAADVWAGADLPACYREAGFHVGVHLPDDGELHPARFVRGLAKAAVAAGAVLHEGTTITSMDAQGAGDVTIHTSSAAGTGTVRASLVVVCTNAYAGEILPFFADKVDPVRGQMLATAPVPPLFGCPVYADHGYDYWRQDEAGRVVLGGWRNLDPASEVGTAEVLHDGIQTRMVEFLHRFPALREAPITHRWSGTMGFSRDGLPICGAVPGAPGVMAAVGFTGHGFGFAFLAGQAMAQLVIDGRSDFVDAFSARRFAV